MLLNKLFARQTTANPTGPSFFNLLKPQAGVRITHDNALETAAVFACVRVIAEDIASLPWHVFTRRPGGGRDRAVRSYVEYLLNERPNPEISACAFRETLIAWGLTYGNGYAEIERDLAGRPAALWPLSPDRVEPKRRANGALIYEVANARQANTFIEPADMYHLHGIGFDGITGYSLVEKAARSIGLSISLEEFGAQFFGNGATLSGVLEVPQGAGMTKDAKLEMRNAFNAAHQGARNAHKVEVLDLGTTFKPISTPPESGQFTESQQNQVEVICRWFRVSPQKVGHLLRMTFNNVEQLSIDHVQDALVPWVTRCEQEANFKLISQQNYKQYSKLIVNGLLRGDVTSRTTYYREMWNLGVFSVNEIRELEDMNPVTNGDKRFVQLNMTTLDKAGEEPAQPTKPAPAQSDTSQQVVNALRVLVMRENNRFKKIANYPLEDYLTRAYSYISSQRGTIRDQACCVARDVCLDIDNETVEAFAKQYTEAHIEAAKTRAYNYHTSKIELNELDQGLESAACYLADIFIEYLALANTKGKSNGH